jgi:hypothetical protein
MYGFCVRYATVEDARNGSGHTTLHNGKGYESAVWEEEEGTEALLYTSRANDNVHMTIRCLHSGRDQFHVQTEEGRKDVYAYPCQVNFYYGELLQLHASVGFDLLGMRFLCSDGSSILSLTLRDSDKSAYRLGTSILPSTISLSGPADPSVDLLPGSIDDRYALPISADLSASH